MESLFTIGVDPDTTNTAVAVIIPGETPRVVAVYSLKQKGKKDRSACMSILDETLDFFGQRDELLPFGHQIAAVAVEGQDIYQGKDSKGNKMTANPRSILWLAPISGFFLALFKTLAPKAQIMFPSPASWKGNKPKDKHHHHIGTRLGWEMKTAGKGKNAYAYPLDYEVAMSFDDEILQGDWKHLMDAIGLAIWAGDEVLKQKNRDKALANA